MEAPDIFEDRFGVSPGFGTRLCRLGMNEGEIDPARSRYIDELLERLRSRRTDRD